jgi:hypothetical protein
MTGMHPEDAFDTQRQAHSHYAVTALRTVAMTALILTLTSALPAAPDNKYTVQKLRNVCLSDEGCDKYLELLAEKREVLMRIKHGHKTPPGTWCPSVATSELLLSFLLWSDLHRDQWQESAQDSVLRVWNSDFPCAQP